MSKKNKTQLNSLNLQDQQLLETCGQAILHSARRIKVMEEHKNSKHNLNSK